MRYRRLMLVGAVICAACGGDSLVLPDLAPPTAAKLSVAAQPPPQAFAGTTLAPELRVQVQTSDGTGVKAPGVAVTAALDGTGAQLRGQLTQPTDAAGIAAFTDLAIEGPAGSYTIRFSSAGLSPATTQPIALAVRRVITTTSIRSLDPAHGTALTPVTVSFTVVAATGTDTPTGNVTATDGAQSCTAPVSGGRCAFTPQTGGDKTITLTYAGDGFFEASRATASYQVDRVATTADAPTVEPGRYVSRGTSVTLSTRITATTGSARGKVIFARDACGSGMPYGDPVAVQPDGTASLTTTFSDVGTQSVVACYGGDPTFAPAESPPTSVLVLPW